MRAAILVTVIMACLVGLVIGVMGLHDAWSTVRGDHFPPSVNLTLRVDGIEVAESTYRAEPGVKVELRVQAKDMQDLTPAVSVECSSIRVLAGGGSQNESLDGEFPSGHEFVLVDVGAYEFTGKAVDASGNIAWSDAIRVLVSGPQ